MTLTRVATRSAGTDGDGDSDGAPETTGVGLGDGLGDGDGVTTTGVGLGVGATPASTGPVYDRRPAATSMTPVAVSSAGRRRVRMRSSTRSIGRTA
jgi:hypothetical protein